MKISTLEDDVAEIIAPMSGKMWKVLVNVGDAVKEDDEVAILEAMKMEIPVVSPQDGKVKAVLAKEGEAVEAESVIMTLE